MTKKESTSPRPDPRPTDHVHGLPAEVTRRGASTGSADADVINGLRI